MLIHDDPLDAVHGQAEGNVTDTEPCAPVDPTEAFTGAIVAEHVTPACVTVNVSPPTVMVPVLLERLVFAAIVKATVPSPEPLPPDVIEIQEAEAVAVHEHPTSVSTLRVLLVAAAGTDVLTGESEKAHACPDCVTVNV